MRLIPQSPYLRLLHSDFDLRVFVNVRGILQHHDATIFHSQSFATSRSAYLPIVGERTLSMQIVNVDHLRKCCLFYDGELQFVLF